MATRKTDSLDCRLRNVQHHRISFSIQKLPFFNGPDFEGEQPVSGFLDHRRPEFAITDIPDSNLCQRAGNPAAGAGGGRRLVGAGAHRGRTVAFGLAAAQRYLLAWGCLQGVEVGLEGRRPCGLDAGADGLAILDHAIANGAARVLHAVAAVAAVILCAHGQSSSRSVWMATR